MGSAILPGSPPVEITLRRSVRARRLSLRVSRLDGRVTLSYPEGTGEAEALNFAREKEPWIRHTLRAATPPVALGLGAEIPVDGTLRRLVSGTGNLPLLDATNLAVPGPPERVAARVAAFLKSRARDRLATACDAHAAHLGVAYTAITLRDTRSRWGSCSTSGRLMFSWRLAMAPADVLDYVSAHEVSHLVAMNHSPAFWRVVARLRPDYGPLRAWLRTEGARLHAIRF